MKLINEVITQVIILSRKQLQSFCSRRCVSPPEPRVRDGECQYHIPEKLFWQRWDITHNLAQRGTSRKSCIDSYIQLFIKISYLHIYRNIPGHQCFISLADTLLILRLFLGLFVSLRVYWWMIAQNITFV